VEDITLRYIRLRDFDGNVHYVPNGLVTTVTNMSRDFACAVMDIGVAYREDLDEVFMVMRETAAAMQEDPAFGPRILEPLEIAGVDQLGDSAVIVRCRIKTHVLEQWAVRREYLRRLKSAFDARGIEIPYPQLTISRASIPGPAARSG
jgi:small conductance mechanosensitive channel